MESDADNSSGQASEAVSSPLPQVCSACNNVLLGIYINAPIMAIKHVLSPPPPPGPFMLWDFPYRAALSAD